MKKYTHSKKVFTIASAILALCIGFFVVWQYVIPFYVATEVLGKFENACYAGDSKKMLELMYSQSAYYRLMQESLNKRHANLFTKEFNKFEKGFKIIKTRHRFATLAGDNPATKEIIIITVAKITKKDSNERSMGSELAKINGEWKIMCYYFPDYVDY